MKYSKSDYEGFDPFECEELRCRIIKLVKARKEHICALSEDDTHSIKPGEIARREKAIFEGKWSVSYCCIPCMESWFEEIGLEPTEGKK